MSWAEDYNADLIKKRLAKFEEQAVDIVLDVHKLRDPWRQRLLNNHKRGYGTWELRLDEFHETFRSFPVRLFVSTSWSVKDQHPVSKLFGTFPSLPLCREFCDLRDCNEEFAALAMVIKWPYFRGALVLHNHSTGPVIGTRMQVCLPDGSGLITLQPLHDLLKELAWTPSPCDGDQRDE